MAMTKCKECSKDISSEAVTCPHCGAPVKKPARTFGCGTAIVLGALVTIPLVMFMGSPRPVTRKPATETVAPPTPQPTKSVASAPAPHENTWVYSVSNDEMSGSEAQHAMLASTNRFELRFPYQGTQFAALMVRRHPRHGIDAMVTIERGQLLCGVSDACTLQVRFDNAPAQQWTFVEPESDDSTVLFFRDGRAFATKLATAKIVRIELKFFQQSPVVAVFDTKGFDSAKFGL